MSDNLKLTLLAIATIILGNGLAIMFIGKLILISFIVLIVASCIPIGNYKFNPTLSIIKILNKNKNQDQLGTRG